MKKIGVVDSGVGALAVLSRLLRYPANFICRIDNASFPYAEKTAAELNAVAAENVAYFQKEGADTVVFASVLLSRFAPVAPSGMEIFRCEPPFRQAEEYSVEGYLTVADAAYAPFARGKVVTMPDLTYMAERGDSGKNICAYIERQTEQAGKFDCVVLASTHFCWLKRYFSQVFPAAKIFDSAESLAGKILRTRKKSRNNAETGSLRTEFSRPDAAEKEKFEKMLKKMYKCY